MRRPGRESGLNLSFSQYCLPFAFTTGTDNRFQKRGFLSRYKNRPLPTTPLYPDPRKIYPDSGFYGRSPTSATNASSRTRTTHTVPSPPESRKISGRQMRKTRSGKPLKNSLSPPLKSKKGTVPGPVIRCFGCPVHPKQQKSIFQYNAYPNTDKA